jgi:hypothetical protein
MSTPYTPGVPHWATTQIVELIKDISINDEYTDEAMRKACGKDTKPGGDGYRYLRSALRIVLRDHGRLCKRVRGKGCIKCLNVGDAITVVKSNLRAIRKNGTQSVRALAAVSEHASAEELPQVNALVAQVGTLAVLASSTQTKKLISHKMTEPIDQRQLLVAMVESQKTNGERS